MEFDINRPVLLAGPTGSGKSALALEIAATANGCVINADALQVYDCWRILTARPHPEALARCPHRLYGHIGINEPYSVGRWLREVTDILAECRTRRQLPIITGGSGLYFTALTDGLAEIPPIPAGIRREGNRIRDESPERFADELRAADPGTAAVIDLANPARTQRAWEVLAATGIGFRQWHQSATRPLLPVAGTLAVVIDAPPAWLNPRIDRRFDDMIRAGAVDECRAVLASGYDPAKPSCQALGVRELVAFIRGQQSLMECVEQAKTRTRQYARRQRNWYRRRMSDWPRIPAGSGLTDLAEAGLSNVQPAHFDVDDYERLKRD